MFSISRYFVRRYFKKAGITIEGPNAHDIRVGDPRFYARLVIADLCGRGSLALGESYMDGWWHCDRIDSMICRLLSHRGRKKKKQPPLGRWLRSLLWLVYNPQSLRRSRRVAREHYDIGNDLYKPMLGRSMAYSCGYWRKALTLDEAEFAKYDLLCRKLGLDRAGKGAARILDIGCGFGGFARYAAETYGAHVVGITLSERQLEFGKERCAGLPVDLRILDYRKLSRALFPQGFDFVVSVGMFEHVGPRNYDPFMRIAARLLRPEGIFLLHTIGSRNRGQDSWIEKYIFPGGMLPRLDQILAAARPYFPQVWDVHNFGPYYDPTLMAWLTNFREQRANIALASDPRFERMWTYYLSACAGAFRAQALDLWQIVFSRGPVPGGYQSVR